MIRFVIFPDVKLKGLSVLVKALLLIAALPVNAEYYLASEELADLFGPTGCIEGKHKSSCNFFLFYLFIYF